jgi:hypothetical protein
MNKNGYLLEKLVLLPSVQYAVACHKLPFHVVQCSDKCVVYYSETCIHRFWKDREQ